MTIYTSDICISNTNLMTIILSFQKKYKFLLLPKAPTVIIITAEKLHNFLSRTLYRYKFFFILILVFDLVD